MLRKLSLLLTIAAALGLIAALASCGVRGPLEPPPAEAASTEAPSAEAAPAEAAVPAPTA